MKVESESEVAQSCLTLSDPMDCSPPGSSIHGIFRATVLEWGATSILRAANSQGRWDSKSGWAKSGFPWGSLQRFTVSLIHSVLKRRNTEALPCQHPGAPERKSRWRGRLLPASRGPWKEKQVKRKADCFSRDPSSTWFLGLLQMLADYWQQGWLVFNQEKPCSLPGICREPT